MTYIIISRTEYDNLSKELNLLAIKLGVSEQDIEYFNNEGKKALYGGLNNSEVKARKDLSIDTNYVESMGDLELSSNNFQMALTIKQLSKGDIKTQQDIIDTHIHYGKAIRKLLEEDGGLMPEDMPVLESTKQVVDRSKDLDYL